MFKGGNRMLLEGRKGVFKGRKRNCVFRGKKRERLKEEKESVFKDKKTCLK